MSWISTEDVRKEYLHAYSTLLTLECCHLLCLVRHLHGVTNKADIYFSINNTVGETNPIVASLNIFGGEIKCMTCVILWLSVTPFLGLQSVSYVLGGVPI